MSKAESISSPAETADARWELSLPLRWGLSDLPVILRPLLPTPLLCRASRPSGSECESEPESDSASSLYSLCWPSSSPQNDSKMPKSFSLAVLILSTSSASWSAASPDRACWYRSLRPKNQDMVRGVLNRRNILNLADQ